MTHVIKLGLERLLEESDIQEKVKGKVGYLGHSAAVTSQMELGLAAVKKLFGDRLIKAFGPQHGFVTDVQDNMIETDDFHHPYFDLPIYSLYGSTRVPTKEMLSGIDTLIIDLQDVGTRVYTYITTLGLCMEACAGLGIKVVVLDRPNPVGGESIEGPVLEKEWRSFVGHHPIPQRHALTFGEVALLQNKVYKTNCDLEVVTMKGWKRSMNWLDCKRIWVNPSPNLPTPESSLTFCGTVLYEGTLISEGRGTTRSLEVLGAPGIDAFTFAEQCEKAIKETNLEGFVLRPLYFHPMFQKHSGKTCGGVHIHPTDWSKMDSWHLGALLMREFSRLDPFRWNDAPYEYETKSLAINYINGSETLKDWVDKKGSFDELRNLGQKGHDEYRNIREDILLYH